MKNNRVVWVDIAKYIGIFFVMISHLECNTAILHSFYAPFFLNIFYFCSGYVYKNGQSFDRFLYKKFRQLFVPWFVFSNFNIVLRNTVSLNEHTNLWEELQDNMLQAWGKGQELWFVAALFVAFIPFYFLIVLVENVQKHYHYFFVVSIIVGLFVVYYYGKMFSYISIGIPYPWNSIWHINAVAGICFYMLIGYVYANYLEPFITGRCPLKRNCLILIVLATYAILLFISCKSAIWSGVWLFNVCKSISGVFFVVVVSKIINRNRFMEYCGQNTLIFFALHGKVYSVIQTLLKKIIPVMYADILATQYRALICSIVMSVVLSVVLTIPSMIINRYFSFILGRKPIHVRME